VVYRNRADDVKFMELNAITARLLALLEPGRLSGRQALMRTARELGHAAPEALVREGAGLLDLLRARDIVLGARRRARR